LKKRIILLICILVLISVLYVGCKNDTTNPKDKGKANSSYSQEMPTSNYQLNKPLIDGNDCYEVMELSLPQNINNMKMALVEIMEESKLLVLLYKEETLPVIKEIGVYDLDSNQYNTYFTISENKTVSIEYSNDNLVIYKETDLLTERDSLYYFDICKNCNVKIYDFSLEYTTSSVAYNNIIVYDNNIYFDDVIITDNEISGVSLLQYDLITKEIVIFKKDSQNPILLNNKLMYISKEKDKSSFFLESNLLSVKIDLDERISKLTSANDELYSIKNKSNDEKTNRTIWSINSLLEKEELLTSSIAIDQIVANEYIVAWRNFTPDKPLLYLRKKDSFSVISDIENAYNTYLLGDKYGILICSYDASPNKYYKFTYT